MLLQAMPFPRTPCAANPPPRPPLPHQPFLQSSPHDPPGRLPPSSGGRPRGGDSGTPVRAAQVLSPHRPGSCTERKARQSFFQPQKTAPICSDAWAMPLSSPVYSSRAARSPSTLLSEPKTLPLSPAAPSAPPQSLVCSSRRQ